VRKKACSEYKAAIDVLAQSTAIHVVQEETNQVSKKWHLFFVGKKENQKVRLWGGLFCTVCPVPYKFYGLSIVSTTVCFEAGR
jgi:hypothetical protein